MNQTDVVLFPMFHEGIDYLWQADNASFNYYDSNPQAEQELSQPVVIVLCIIYAIIFCVTIPGNLLVCYTIWTTKDRNKKKHPAPDIFLFSLSINDILVVIICIPFLVFSKIVYTYWPFGTHMCILAGFSQNTIILHRAFTLIVITIDCHRMSRKPHAETLTKFRAKVCIFCCLILAVIISIPIAVYSKTETYQTLHVSRTVCIEEWPYSQGNKAYNIFTVIVQYFIPLSVLIVCYTHIGIIIYNNHVPEESTHQRNREKKKRKTLTMMVIVVVCYAISWTPLNILNFIGDLVPAFYQNDNVHIIWLVSHCLAFGNSGVNPILYGWMRPSYRDSYKRCLLKLCLVKTKDRERRVSFSISQRITNM